MPDTPEARLNLTIHKLKNDIYVVEFEDRKILEEQTINQIGERLAELAESQKAPKLLLDFHLVEHLSSAALGMLITLNRKLSEQDGRLVLANIHPQIFEVFRITRLNKLFNIQNSVEEGLQVFA